MNTLQELSNKYKVSIQEMAMHHNCSSLCNLNNRNSVSAQPNVCENGVVLLGCTNSKNGGDQEYH